MLPKLSQFAFSLNHVFPDCIAPAPKSVISQRVKQRVLWSSFSMTANAWKAPCQWARRQRWLNSLGTTSAFFSSTTSKELQFSFAIFFYTIFFSKIPFVLNNDRVLLPLLTTIIVESIPQSCFLSTLQTLHVYPYKAPPTRECSSHYFPSAETPLCRPKLQMFV